MYDYLVVGAGLFGAVFAHEAHKAGKKVLVIDKRPQIAGNIYTEEVDGINVHKYGAHISIPPTKRYGSMCSSLQSSTATPILRWHGTRTSFITCRLT